MTNLDQPMDAALGDGVYRILWQRIVDRELRPGEKLSDLRLSAELGVSRTPVREALHRLVKDGIVRAERNRGFSVVCFSRQDIIDIYELRSVLEAAALRIAASKFSHRELETLLQVNDRLLAKLDSTPPGPRWNTHANEFLQVDRTFHRIIAHSAGNPRLTAALESIWGQIAVFQNVGLWLPNWIRLSAREHHEIIQALLDDRHALAVRRMERHIRLVNERILNSLPPEPPRKEQRRLSRTSESKSPNLEPASAWSSDAG